ncbi:protein misato [Scaptodrosophila lebanonensis]|uniref:Protein misato n=1 Tax=Drosophila lebanonensis TaxID=7225 RepID=A0A6J2TQ09_DROLE|nr:protein misato [Scaptodrosophila lebanonensis]
MAHTREILTFQFGTYANYVGAHFWNQQEANFVYDGQGEVDEQGLPNNDILYREGQNDQNQSTYTPRLLSVDLAGTLAHLPLAGELYGDFIQRKRDELDASGDGVESTKKALEANQLSTSGKVEVREEPPTPMSEYQRDLLMGAVNTLDRDYKLAETCRTWADFLYARYHPRTLNVLHQYTSNPDLQALGTHTAGAELWSSSFEEDFCDRIRLYVEECDGLQGFQLLFDIDDGFSGLATKCLEHLNDEYSRASFVVPLHYPRNLSYAQADTRTSHNIRVVNAVLSYNHLSDYATMFTPLSTLESIWRNNTLKSRHMPGLHWQADNLYQTSAVLGSYLDTISLSYRMRQTPETLLRFCDRVGVAGRKLTAAAFALPLDMLDKQDLIECLDQRGGKPLLTQITPQCEPGTAHVVQSVVARGIPVSRLKRPPEQAGEQLRMAAYNCGSISQMLQLYYQCAYHNSLSNVISTVLPIKTQLPFPYELFDKNVNIDGYKLPGEAQRDAGTRVASAPALGALQSSSRLGEHIDALHAQTHRVQLAKLQSYSQAGLEREEYETALEHLLEFRDNYSDSQYL